MAEENKTLGSSALNLIRKYFYRDRIITQPYDTRGYSINQYTGGERALGASSPVGTSYNSELINSTEIAQDFVGRMADYEDMEAYPELGQALNIYADEATQQDSITGKSVWVESDNEAIQSILEFTLHNQLKIEEDLWAMARTLAHYGNMYQEVIVLSGVGVIKLIDYPVAQMRRVSDKFGNDFGFIWDEAMSFSMNTAEFMRRLHDRDQGLNTSHYSFMHKLTKVFEEWEVVHYRLRTGSRSNTLYGQSILEPARWVWKRISMMEDAMVLFKLTRSPQRYVFYVDVGDVPPNEARKIINQFKQDFRKQKFVNPETGKIDFRYNPLSTVDDFFVSKRKEKRSTEIEVLSGLAEQGVEDSNYFREKLFASLGIPKSYLGADETIGRANLGQMDVRFAKTIMRLQREMKNGIRRICDIDLAARNIDPDKVEYKIGMVIPSGALELAHIEVQKAKVELASMYQGLNFPDWYLWTNIIGLSEQEANDVEFLRAKQEGAFPQDQQESVKLNVQKNIDRQLSNITRAHLDKQSAILEHIEKGQSTLGRRLAEVKSLMGEFKKLRAS